MKERSPFVAVALVAVSAAFLIGGYEFVRSAGNTLFKTVFSAEKMAVANLFMAPGLVFALYAYGKLLTWFGPRKTTFVTYLCAGLTMIAGYLSIRYGFERFIFFVFVFRKIYIVLLVEQYWSFLTSTLTDAQAKKTFGAVLALSTLGAIGGGFLVGRLAVPLGTNAMLLCSAACILPAWLLFDLSYRFCGEPGPRQAQPTRAKTTLALGLFRKSALLSGLLVIVLSTQVLSSAHELSFQTLLEQNIVNDDEQTAYSGNYFGKLNAAALVLNVLVVPILMSTLPLTIIHSGIPVIHLLMALGALFVPGLSMVAMALLTFKAMDYSIFRVAKELLYIPMSFDARYRAKQVIDSFGYRFGEWIASLVIVAVQSLGLFFASFYAVAAIVGSLIWIFALIPMLKEYRRLSAH